MNLEPTLQRPSHRSGTHNAGPVRITPAEFDLGLAFVSLFVVVSVTESKRENPFDDHR